MTHINDRHITAESFKTAVQRRIANGPQTTVTQPVTIIKKPMPPNSSDNTTGTASPTLSTSSNSSLPSGSSAAMQAIKRHSMDLINPKELMVSIDNGTCFFFRIYVLLCGFWMAIYFNNGIKIEINMIVSGRERRTSNKKYPIDSFVDFTKFSELHNNSKTVCILCV